MERVSPSRLKSPKVYFTETDPLLLTFVSPHELSEKLKLLCILNDNVVIAASHLLESDMLLELLFVQGNANLLPLFQKGIILPALRDECESFAELVKIKRNSPEPEVLRNKYTLEKGSMLDDNVSRFVEWSAPATSEEFRESAIQVINSPSFRKKLAVRKEIVDELIIRLSKGTPFSRHIVEEAIKVLPEGKRRERVRNSINVSYYLSGAHAVQCPPVVCSNELYGFHDKFQIAYSRTQDHLNIVSYNQLDLFKQYLKDFAVDESALDGLDADAILQIRDERITAKFREAYSDVISRAMKGESDNVATDRYYETKDSLLKLIDDVAKEKMSRRQIQMRRTRRVIRTASISSLITSLLSLLSVAASALTVPTSVAGFALWFVDPLVAKFYKNRGSEFALFADRIREHSLQVKST